jgi:hypothetical protein
MGKIFDSLLSGTTGRTGKIVVTNLFGHEFTRIRPRKRTGEPTAKQALVQQRVTLGTHFMMSYRKFACEYFGHRVGLHSPFNNAFASLLDAMQLDFENNKIIMHHNAVSFSKGMLLGLIPVTLASNAPNTFKLEWIDNALPDSLHKNDNLQILFSPDNTFDTVFIENAAKRVDTSHTVQVLPMYAGQLIHVWAAFTHHSNKTACNSVYLGTVEIEA